MRLCKRISIPDIDNPQALTPDLLRPADNLFPGAAGIKFQRSMQIDPLSQSKPLIIPLAPCKIGLTDLVADLS